MATRRPVSLEEQLSKLRLKREQLDLRVKKQENSDKLKQVTAQLRAKGRVR
jgi:hypothetical protein